MKHYPKQYFEAAANPPSSTPKKNILGYPMGSGGPDSVPVHGDQYGRDTSRWPVINGKPRPHP